MQDFFDFICEILSAGGVTEVMQISTTGDTQSDRTELSFPVFAVHHARDSVAQLRDMEIDEQSDPDPAQPHI
jgi:hypothetical protein